MSRILSITMPGLRLGWLPLVLVACLLGAEYITRASELAWFYTAEQYQQGQWWLPFSSQWVHVNLLHTLLNCAGLLLIYFCLLSDVAKLQIFLSLCASSGFIALYLVAYPHHYDFYAGFSGLLYGLFSLGVMHYARREAFSAALLAIALVAKLGWDFFSAAALQPVPWLGARVAVEVHIAGISGSFVAMGLYQAYKKLIITQGLKRP